VPHARAHTHSLLLLFLLPLPHPLIRVSLQFNKPSALAGWVEQETIERGHNRVFKQFTPKWVSLDERTLAIMLTEHEDKTAPQIVIEMSRTTPLAVDGRMLTVGSMQPLKLRLASTKMATQWESELNRARAMPHQATVSAASFVDAPHIIIREGEPAAAASDAASHKDEPNDAFGEPRAAGPFSIVVFGVSGDLAKKKILPSLWSLYKDNAVSPNVNIVGYARSALTRAALADRIRENITKAEGTSEEFERFMSRVSLVQGEYDKDTDFQALNAHLAEREKTEKCNNRIFYLALPPSVFECTTTNIRHFCMAESGWNRLILEKPFGRDLESYDQLTKHLSRNFKEEQLFRIDHYLGKEMVQNLLVLRFSNRAFEPLWSRDHIACVQIVFKEPFGTEGRGGYFDEFGIIRDVMQNHLLQLLCLVAMERPATCDLTAIQAEKLKLLQAIQTLTLKDVVVGQYVASNKPNVPESFKSYTDDETVAEDSHAATFASAIFRIANERWDGVPFFLKCGKALEERKTEIRIQFKEVHPLFGPAVRNELVIRVQPSEAVYLKVLVKQPGMTFETTQTDLDLTYKRRFEGAPMPEAYVRLLLDVVNGKQLHFVHGDELREAWRIFTPVLHELDESKIAPIKYPFGSRGPPESDQLLQDIGYQYTEYDWK